MENLATMNCSMLAERCQEMSLDHVTITSNTANFMVMHNVESLLIFNSNFSASQSVQIITVSTNDCENAPSFFNFNNSSLSKTKMTISNICYEHYIILITDSVFDYTGLAIYDFTSSNISVLFVNSLFLSADSIHLRFRSRTCIGSEYYITFSNITIINSTVIF